MSTQSASARETTEGTVYTVTGGDWDEVVEAAARADDERIVLNMGPQHPSTHGVLRLILEIDGETVTEARCGIGYLHTGIEKNLEYRTWTQGTTFVTRMDYLTSFFNETAYCLAVEKLLGIEDQITERTKIIRVLLMELNRLSSHLVCIATGGMELGATTIMIYGFRDREMILDIYELITGLRMNHAYIRPGGLAQDLPPGAVDQIREFVKKMKKNLPEYDKLATGNPIFKARMQDIGYLDLAGCMALGATGPILRSTGLPHDLRKSQPYCDYETYDFEIPTADTCDSYGRFLIRLEEMRQSLGIVEQCLDRLQPGPVMVADKKIAWPAQYEAPLGVTLRQLLEMSGGMRPGHRLKFWTPGGSSTPMFTDEHLDVPLDYEGVGAAGSMLGTKALQCFDETTCVVRAVTRWTEFYAHESCGKCTPCREGTYWLVQLLRDIEAGKGVMSDLDKLNDIADNINGKSFCALGDGAASPIFSSLKYFREEYEQHITGRGCPFDPAKSTAWADHRTEVNA
ncbi:NADH-quinone oxidoreductase subunit D [Streptomyces chartreusis]